MGVLPCRRLGPVLVGASLLALAASAVAAKTSWRKVTETDLHFIHDTLREAHPGYIDQSAAGEAFRAWLETGLGDSLKLAQRVRSPGEFEAVLRFYGSGFRDGHLGVGTNAGVTQSAWWTTGWLVAWRNGEYVVSQHLPGNKANLPPIGSRVLRCDGLTPAKRLEREVAPFFDRRVELESVASGEAQFLTLNSRTLLPWRKPTKHCVLALPTNEIRSYRLQWRRLEAMADEAGQSVKRPSMGVVDLGEGRFWVHASNFWLKGKDIEDYQAMLARLPGLREARLVVFDLRGNEGGDGGLGMALLNALLEPGYVQYYLDRSGYSRAYAEYRVSSIALTVFAEQYLARAKSLDGESGDGYLEIVRQRDRMRDALAQGKEWLIQWDNGAQPARESPEPLGSKPQLAILTHSRCASACLDFVDYAKALPGMVHLGRPTSADTVFMERGIAQLPSGLGSLYFPFKVWRNRPRGNNQPYLPDELFSGDIDDTAAVQTWVLEQMAAREGAAKAVAETSR